MRNLEGGTHTMFVNNEVASVTVAYETTVVVGTTEMNVVEAM